MTTNWVDLIELENFIQQVFNKSVPIYDCYVIMIKNCHFQIHSSQISQISATTFKTITLPDVYNDFDDDLSTENASYLTLH